MEGKIFLFCKFMADFPSTPGLRVCLGQFLRALVSSFVRIFCLKFGGLKPRTPREAKLYTLGFFSSSTGQNLIKTVDLHSNPTQNANDKTPPTLQQSLVSLFDFFLCSYVSALIVWSCNDYCVLCVECPATTACHRPTIQGECSYPAYIDE